MGEGGWGDISVRMNGVYGVPLTIRMANRVLSSVAFFRFLLLRGERITATLASYQGI